MYISIGGFRDCINSIHIYYNSNLGEHMQEKIMEALEDLDFITESDEFGLEFL